MTLAFMFVLRGVGDQELDYPHNREPNQLGNGTSFISATVRKYSGKKKQLERGKRKFYFSSRVKLQSVTVGRSGWEEHEAAVHLTPWSTTERMDVHFLCLETRPQF